MKIDWFAIIYKIIKTVNYILSFFKATKLDDLQKPEVKPAPEPIPDTIDFSENFKKMLELHNNLRAEKKLQPLSLDKKYCEIAQEHSEFMKKKNRLSHKGFSGRASELNAKAENVAMGGVDGDSIFKMWVDSKGHLSNILTVDAKVVGFGEVEGWWTAIFG